MTPLPGLDAMAAVLDGLPFPAALMDGRGTYVKVNALWDSQDDYYPGSGLRSGEGGNLLELCLYGGTEAGRAAHDVVMTLLRGEVTELALPFGGTEHARYRALEVHLRRLPTDGGGGGPLFLLRIHDASAEGFERDRTRVLDLMARGRPQGEILHEVAQLLDHLHPGGRSAVFLLRGHRLYVGAAPRLPAPFTRLLDGLDMHGRLEVLPSGLGEAFVRDLSAYPQWATRLRENGMGEFPLCATLPVQDRSGRFIGSLALFLPTDRTLTAADLDVLRRVQHLTSVVIEHDTLIRELEHRALHDDLTGLPNRALFSDRLEQALEHAERSGQPVAVLFFDIDDFKAINDAAGHLAGDDVLREVARRLGETLRPGETLARFAGDEFVALLPGLSAAEAAARAAEMTRGLREPLHVGGRELFLMLSVGIAASPEGGRDAQTLQRHADVAMYRAKSLRTGAEIFESELPRRDTHRLDLLSQLRRAEELGELRLHFQPQLDLRSGQATGVEALIRWQHPQLGLVPPADFIPLAEDSGLIVPIGRWVLAEACRQGGALMARAPGLRRVAVNVSALQFSRPDFVEMVAQVLAETGFPAEGLELELTERLVMEDAPGAAQRMGALRELGVSLALDDFGTGFSSLSYLPHLPLNVIKIDRSFVDGAPAGGTLPIIRAILSMAAQFGFEVIAEGIESAEHVQAMLDAGCWRGQGYHLGRPVPADRLWPPLT